MPFTASSSWSATREMLEPSGPLGESLFWKRQTEQSHTSGPQNVLLTERTCRASLHTNQFRGVLVLGGFDTYYLE